MLCLIASVFVIFCRGIGGTTTSSDRGIQVGQTHTNWQVARNYFGRGEKTLSFPQTFADLASSLFFSPESFREISLRHQEALDMKRSASGDLKRHLAERVFTSRYRSSAKVQAISANFKFLVLYVHT